MLMTTSLRAVLMTLSMHRMLGIYSVPNAQGRNSVPMSGGCVVHGDSSEHNEEFRRKTSYIHICETE